MMSRPVINEKVLQYLRQQPVPLSPKLRGIEEFANEKRIPIIPHETVSYLYQLVNQLRPTKILEVGTAIGFSAALFVEASQQQTRVTTIDRFEEMYQRAQTNWQSLGYQSQIQLLTGDAADILPMLTGQYELIFLDAAKAQYINFLPEALRLLAPEGVLLIDDVLQGGTIFEPIESIRHRDKGIHRHLNQLLDTVYADDELLTTLLPLGDGLLKITRREIQK
ncbi:O-methyltransferase [Lapidilactobacillus mulanensis]|nr:O-methyltransferase [Lapidilactobacillus mulanensis]